MGARQIMASGEKAKAYNLSVVAGTQRRHQRQYMETDNHVKNGAIGEIVAARAYWCQGQLWYQANAGRTGPTWKPCCATG